MVPAIVGGVILFLLLSYFWFLKSFLYICGPDEVLVFSGRKTSTEGVDAGFRVVKGGRAYRYPIIETVNRMDLKIFSVHIHITGAFSRGNIPLHVHAIANVKVTSNERLMGNAIERFLGRHPTEIQRVAKETLEGNLRGILATMTPEEVNEDRLKFAARLAEDAEEDLRRLGLHLDTLKIQNVSDDVDYLDSIGRKRIAEVLRDAEISESDARREAENAVAEANAAGQIAREQAEAHVQQKQNELRQIRAELEAEVQATEEKAQGSAEAARSQAAQALEAVRITLETLRLQADRVIPAQIEREAADLLAKGRAAPIEARAAAQAQALTLLGQAWAEAGDNAMDIFVVQQVDRILEEVTRAARAVTLEQVALIDGGSGDTLPAYVAAYPRVVAALLAEIKNTIGIDVTGAVTGANGTSASARPSGFKRSGTHTLQMPRVPSDSASE